MTAHGTASNAKTATPLALLTLARKSKKPSGKTGHAEEAVFLKGTPPFARLMSAKISSKLLASLLPKATSGIKSAGIVALAVKGAKTPAIKLPEGLRVPIDESGKPLLGKEEKADGKKKAAKLPAHLVGVMAEVGAAVPDSAKHSEAGAAGKKDAPAALQTEDAARASQVRRAEPRIQVVDLRRKSDGKPLDESSAQTKTAQTAAPAKDTALSVSPRLGAFHDIGAEAPRKAELAPAVLPQNALERLREMAGSELVKATNLVLRDGGGEIRLVLKPESLGSVRIRMILVDNQIEGRIIVDNSAVKQVIDKSIDALARALTAEGFQTASLQVSVGGQSADSGRQMQEPSAAVRKVTALGFEQNVPDVESLTLDDLLVNLFV